jgi:hypothetical protein
LLQPGGESGRRKDAVIDVAEGHVVGPRLDADRVFIDKEAQHPVLLFAGVNLGRQRFAGDAALIAEVSQLVLLGGR